ncbi:MAG: elongation factor P [Candidatus Cloacimonadota bacterium]|nr:elongation factor P [Candidatus Cloacimonadota bacterium]
MASTSDFRNGMVLDFKDGLYEIVEFLHVKPGKGGAFVRTKLKNIETGSVVENTFRAGEKVKEIRVERHKMEYLYKDGQTYYVMDPQTYEQIPLNEDLIGDAKDYLTENIELKVVKAKDEIIKIEMPTTVNLKVTQCEPGVRGNTVSNVTKTATLESGLEIQIPMFVNTGETVKVDTRTGEYCERVK